MQIKKEKSNTTFYKSKYILTLYNVRLSEKDKGTFYLEPKEKQNKNGIKRVEFKAKSPEIRAKWFIALNKAIKENEI